MQENITSHSESNSAAMLSTSIKLLQTKFMNFNNDQSNQYKKQLK